MAIRTFSAYDCDPDFRRDPKTDLYCWRCQKDLKPGQPRRYIHLINDGNEILHPGSEGEYTPDDKDCGVLPVGMDCAKKIGIEWTTEIPPA
jgi:hypothetical protein